MVILLEKKQKLNRILWNFSRTPITSVPYPTIFDVTWIESETELPMEAGTAGTVDA